MESEETDGMAILSEILELKQQAKQRRRELIRTRETPVRRTDNNQPDPELKEIEAEIRRRYVELDAVIVDTAITLARADKSHEITIPDLQYCVCGCRTYSGGIPKKCKDMLKILFNARMAYLLKKNGFVIVDDTLRHVKYTYRGDNSA